MAWNVQHMQRMLIYLALFVVWYSTPFKDAIASSLVDWCLPRSFDVPFGKACAEPFLFGDSGFESAAQQERVKRIGKDVVSAFPEALKEGYEFSFEVVDTNYVNAFALPSGAIFITDELISDLDATDDEIAAVIAKKVGHVVHRHVQKQWMRESAPNFVFLAAQHEGSDTFGAALGEVLLKGLSRSASGIESLAFSRAQDVEADTTAWDALTAASGFDQTAMISLFEKVAQLAPEHYKLASGGKTHWDAMHPGSAERKAKGLRELCGAGCEARRPAKLLAEEKRKQPGHLDRTNDSMYHVFKCELTKYYQTHAPDSVHKVKNLADKYFSNPEENWQLIERHYGKPRPSKSYCRVGDFDQTEL
jgi:hypothetical protein